MSKDIWHKADEAPRYRFQCVYYHRNGKDYYFGEYDPIFRVFMGKKTFHQDEVWKFAFAEDVIACLDEQDRTHKELEIANAELEYIKEQVEKNGAFDSTRKELEQSETCCTEWEKQALDYKAENIALSGELERTRKALDVARHTIGWINQMIDGHTDKQAIKIKCEYALEQITALEQKDVK